MGKIHLMDGRIGGVGKSLFTRVMIHVHENLNIPFIAFDADYQTYNVYQYYPEVAHKIKISEEDYTSTDQVIDTLETGQSILINLASNSSRDVQEWFERDRLFTLLAKLAKRSPILRYEIVDWFLSDGTDLSLEQFMASVEEYGEKMTHVLVKNLGRSRLHTWSRGLTDPDLQALLNLNNVNQVQMPKFIKPQGFEVLNLTFAQAIAPDGGDGEGAWLNLLDRQRVVTFLRTAQFYIEELNLLM